MKKNGKKNGYWLAAGIVNLLTALIHTFGGQMDLVSLLLKSNLSDQTKAEWFGVWHMVTILLFATSLLILKHTLTSIQEKKSETIINIGYLYILLSIPFIVSIVINNLLVPQWILLLPIGLLLLFGKPKEKI